MDNSPRQLLRDAINRAHSIRMSGIGRRKKGKQFDSAADWAEHLNLYGRKWLCNVPAHLQSQVIILLKVSMTF